MWDNAIKTRTEKITEQLEQMWNYTQSIADEEDRDLTLPEFKTIDKEKIKHTAKKIEQIISKNPKASPRAKAKLRYIQKNFLENLDKYEEQEKILQDRGSYSKTDPDATFMRMKPKVREFH